MKHAPFNPYEPATTVADDGEWGIYGQYGKFFLYNHKRQITKELNGERIPWHCSRDEMITWAKGNL